MLSSILGGVLPVQEKSAVASPVAEERSKANDSKISGKESPFDGTPSAAGGKTGSFNGEGDGSGDFDRARNVKFFNDSDGR